MSHGIEQGKDRGETRHGTLFLFSGFLPSHHLWSQIVSCAWVMDVGLSSISARSNFLSGITSVAKGRIGYSFIQTNRKPE